jgi:hypothetical protein
MPGALRRVGADGEGFGARWMGVGLAARVERRPRLRPAAAREASVAAGVLEGLRGGRLIGGFYKARVKCSGPAFWRALERLWGGELLRILRGSPEKRANG